MTTELTMLALSIVLGLMQIMIAANASTRRRGALDRRFARRGAASELGIGTAGPAQIAALALNFAARC